MMKLYHGSNMSLDKPDFRFCKPFKDFGRGFYLSDNYDQALELGAQRVRQTDEGVPTVTSFLFDENMLDGSEFKVLIFNDYSEDWVRFVLDNRDRNLQHPIHDYDIVYGPIADDGVSFQLRRYRRGVIKTLPDLIEELKFGKGITFQYFFGTQRALDKLVKICD